MHSRIFELSEVKLDSDDFLDDKTIIYGDSNFIGTTADYVCESADREEDIGWLMDSILLQVGDSSLFVYDEANKTITFKQGFKEAFFVSKFKAFKEKSSAITLEEFAKDKTLTLYYIKEAIEDKFGFQIYNECSIYSLDYFVRNYLKYDTVYYIGGTVDYHH